jgi:PAS domain S-box-containing protein
LTGSLPSPDALMASTDWTVCPIGPPAGWPASLRNVVDVMFGMPSPAFIIWGPQHTLLYNEPFRAIVAATAADTFGKPLPVASRYVGEEFAPLVRGALSGQAVVRQQVHFGPHAWCTVSLSPLRQDDGAIGGAFGVCEFRENEARYQTLFDSIDEGFCVIEFLDGPHGPLSDYVHTAANAAYAVNTGIANVVGQKVREMVPDEADGWVKLYAEVLKTGQPIRFERELVATQRYLELAAFRIEPASRREVAVLFKDVTARKRAERALQELNETLEARVAAALAERKVLADIVEGTNEFVQVVDLDARWVAINGAATREFKRLFGVTPKVGSRLFDVLDAHSRDRETLQRIWSRALGGDDFSEVVALGPEDAPRHYEMHMSMLYDAGGNRIGAYQFAYDVTDRLKEQERLRKAEEALRQAQKMEAVGQLTGGLAHDFNNLLAGISGAFQMIGVRLAQGRTRDVDKYVTAGQGAARRAASLTHRLLAFSRRQTLSPKPLVVNRLMTEFVELVRRTVGPSIDVETIEAGGLWPTLVDANQLENALLNLCINSRDAMPEGGKITIETANKWLDERSARERNLEPGQYITICVSDTGVGIDKATLERVFEPFFTTKPMGQGTGLGLSMVYGFARQSNGHVRIYSEVGKGTMVCVYLPRYHGDEDAEPVPASTPEPLRTSDAVVLVIDDEPTVRMLITDALADLNYTCIEATDGPSGLEVLRSGKRIDLLITDVGLPGGLNGRQVADAAQSLRPDLKVLFITGYAENAALNHGHIGPGMAVLTKPFAISELARRVERMLGRN